MKVASGIVLAGVMLVPHSAYSQANPWPLDTRMWRGTVRFNYNRTTNFASEGSDDERRTSSANCNSVITAYAEIKACKTSAPQWSARKYQRHSQSNSRWTDRSKPCTKGITKPSEIYFPESRGSKQQQITGTEAEDAPSSRLNLLLVVKTDGSYSLDVTGLLPISTKTNESSESRDGCWGKEESSLHTDEPVAGGKQHKRMVANGRVLVDVQYPRAGSSMPLGLATRGQVSGTKISGKLPLISRHDIGGSGDFACWKSHGARITAQSYDEDLLAEWDFELSDACSEVKEAFLGDWAFYQAYMNLALLARAEGLGMTGAQYEDMVAGAAQAGRAEGAGGGDWRAGVDLSTGADCTTPNEDAWAEKNRQECIPEAIIDSVRAHERAHREQCRAAPERFRSATPAAYHEFDGGAYAAGLRVLLAWLEEHCPDFNAQPFRQTLGAAPTSGRKR